MFVLVGDHSAVKDVHGQSKSKKTKLNSTCNKGVRWSVKLSETSKIKLSFFEEMPSSSLQTHRKRQEKYRHIVK